MLTRTLRTLVVVLLVTTLVVVGVVGTSQAMVGRQRDGAAEVAAPMTVRRLKNSVVPAVCDFRAARFVNGVHPDSPRPDYAEAYILGAAGTGGDGPLQAKVGNLTADSVADGVILTLCTYGGTAYYFNAFAYRPDGTRMGRLPIERYIASVDFPPIYGNVSITNREVRLRVWSFRRGDAHCCPSITTNLRLRWNGSRFVRVI